VQVTGGARSRETALTVVRRGSSDASVPRVGGPHGAVLVGLLISIPIVLALARFRLERNQVDIV